MPLDRRVVANTQDNRIEIVESGDHEPCFFKPPVDFQYNYGGLLKDSIVFCNYSDHCMVIGEKSYQTLAPSTPLTRVPVRTFAATTKANDSLWLVGGRDLNSTIFVTKNKILKGPELPLTISQHCIVQINATSFWMMAGEQDGFPSKNTWHLNFEKGFQMTKGPVLIWKRLAPVCGRIIDENGIPIVALVNGYNENNNKMQNMEILKLTNGKILWERGRSKR